MRPEAEPTLPVAQARARWGADVVLAGLFRPGPAPSATTGLTKALTRRTNRRRSRLPPRILVAIDDGGRALVCPVAADAQGGHPEGDDLFVGPLEELGAVPTGELSILVLLEEAWPAVLEAVWMDHDAAVVAALLTGEPIPDDPDRADGTAPGDPRGGAGGHDDHDDDDDEPTPEALLAEAEAFQARANTLRALAAIRREDQAEDQQRP